VLVAIVILIYLNKKATLFVAMVLEGLTIVAGCVFCGFFYFFMFFCLMDPYDCASLAIRNEFWWYVHKFFLWVCPVTWVAGSVTLLVVTVVKWVILKRAQTEKWEYSEMLKGA
jgi:hypothetical protein